MSYYNKVAPGHEHPNSWYIQRQRCYERIIATKKPPTQKTIDKYDIQFDAQGRVIIPKDLAKPKLELKIAPKVMSAQESYEWLMENHKIKGEPPKADIAKKYKQLASIIEVAGGDKDNIVPTLEKPEQLLEALKNKYDNPETLKQKWQVVSTHVNHGPAVSKDKDLIHKYNIIFNDLLQKTKEATSNRLKDEKVYRWDKVLEATDKLDPLHHFFFRLFDEIPIRTEFGHQVPVVHQVSDEPGQSNFVLDRGGHMVEFHLREWKTKSGRYGDEIVYKFSPKLVDLFRRRFPEGVSHLLLPGVGNWGEWVQEGLTKAGFPNFPYGSHKSPVKEVASALRKTLATFRNSAFNKDRPRGAELAQLMLHDHGTSMQVYRHDDFLT